LTAPAIEALGRYFTGKTSKQLEGNKRIEAVMVMNICFTAPVECGKVKPRSHYRRLQPLCQGLGALIARQGDLAGLQVRTRAWQILLSAPPATLTGPLHSWMQAFAAHAEADNISVAQRQTLQEALTARADEPGFIAAFSEIVENLQALESSG
jgi:hypothetical protein